MAAEMLWAGKNSKEPSITAAVAWLLDFDLVLARNLPELGKCFGRSHRVCTPLGILRHPESTENQALR